MKALPELLKSKAYINGKWVHAASNKTFQVENPANGEQIVSVADCGYYDAKEAIKWADKAFQSWKKTTAGTRRDLLMNWYDAIMSNLDELGRLLTLEQGKPLAEAIGEIKYGASFIRWYAEEASRAYGEVIPGPTTSKRILTLRQPIGVVAAITPWNFPVAMITRKIAPALAAGCTVIVKPAEDTPLSALALALLAERAGFPDGVIQVLPCSDPKEVGNELTSSPIVRKISFTGSTEVGKLLMAQSAETVKKVSLELGGNAPFIVFDDANLASAVRGAMASKYRNAGQTCVCANRLYVQEGVYDQFISLLKTEVEKLQTGNGLDADVQIGPLINHEASAKVERLLDDSIQKSGEIITGGSFLDKEHRFFQPTIIANAQPNMQLHQEEIFGPIAAIYKFRTEDEAIEMANNTPYGLASYFYTENLGRMWRVSEALEYGMVGINEGLISHEMAPFGGVKASGIGREGSRHGLDEYLEIKYLCIGSLD